MSTAQPAVDSGSFDYIRAFLAERTAIVLEPNKAYLLESRLGPVLREFGLGTLQALVAALRQCRAGLPQAVVEAFTTHETSFFRDIHPFEAFRTTVLPRILSARGAQRSLNIWCAACSSGQEPYSLAMLMREHFPQLAGWNIRLVATDLSHQILDRARKGVFTQLEVNRGLPAPLLVKYFEKTGLQWQLKPEIRKMVEFSELNLIGAWPIWPRLDVVFLRNVLIYFSPETKKDILGKVERLLADDGVLFLGGAETTMNLTTAFSRQSIGNAGCYVKQNAAASAAEKNPPPRRILEPLSR